MRLPVLILLILALLLLPAANSPAQTPFYPLQIGNRWQYLWDFSLVESTVLSDTLLPNGYHYAVTTFTHALQRQEGNRVFTWDPASKSDRLLYDFGARKGDTLATFVTPSDTMDLIVTRADTETVWGLPRRAWGFITLSRHHADGFVTEGVVDSIGVTFHGTYPQQFFLQGALIDGRSYGSLRQLGGQHDTAFVEYAGDSVRIRHVNIETYGNAAFVSAVEVRHDSIVIVERDTTFLHDKSLGVFDVTTTLAYLPKGKYRVWLYRSEIWHSEPPRDTATFVQTLSFSTNLWRDWISFEFSSTFVRHLGRTPVPGPVYFPLHTGDLWEYGDGFRRQVIKDTVGLGGRRFAVIREWKGDYFFFEYQRQEGDSVFQWEPPDTVEVKVCDFSRGPGDTVSLIPKQFGYDPNRLDTVLHTLEWAGFREIDRVPRRSWLFLENIPHFTDAQHYTIIVDSIGLIATSGAWGGHPWQGAVIDGVKYGTVTALPPPTTRETEFMLFQNYPNPFNPATTIGFSLPHRSRVTLTVFNLLGQKVIDLVNGEIDAGYHAVHFNATNLASGVYIYRIRAGGYTAVKKFALVR